VSTGLIHPSCDHYLPSRRMIDTYPYTPRLADPSALLLRDSYPEIVAPVPRRHQALLQPTPDAWIRTPSPSSRTTSPTTPIRGGFSRASARYSYVSFSSVMEAGNSKETPWQEEQGFGRRWLRWMHKNGVKHWVVPCTLLASILVRWCIGLGSYSGT
jgi:alpha-1,3-glucosyltransferase